MSESTEEIDRGALKWSEIATLARLFPARVWVSVMVLLIGTATAIGETLGVGLAVVLLFTLLRESDRVSASGGVLSGIYDRVVETLGNEPPLIAAVFFGLLVVTAIFAYLNNAIAGMMLNRVAEGIRDRIHDTFLRAGYAYMQRYDHGTLMHILGNESWTVADAFFSLTRIAVNLCAITIFGVGLFVLAWPIGVTALIGAVAAFLILRLVAQATRRLGEKTLAANHVLSERMLISLSGMRTLRVFALEPYLERRFTDASRRVRRRATRTELAKAATGPLNQLFGFGVLLLIVLVAGYSRIDVPTTIAAVLLLFRLQPYLYEIESERVALAGMSAALRQVCVMIDPPGAEWPREGSQPFVALRDSIVFEDVGFTHDPRKGASVSDLSMAIQAGRTTALQGPSGSGKTTILNLILRLYEPESGRILVDGVDLGDIGRTDWLTHVSIAGQDVELIEGTVLENIRLGNAEASIDEVRAVCRMVEILEEIDALPDGPDTAVGAAGLNLSGGQRQRIGLARALLRDPQVLLLDEAMSALETDREARILKRIADMMAGRTVIIVSHRSVSADTADDVIRIRDGRLDTVSGDV